jgi:hypothetical protein
MPGRYKTYYEGRDAADKAGSGKKPHPLVAGRDPVTPGSIRTAVPENDKRKKDAGILERYSSINA